MMAMKKLIELLDYGLQEFIEKWDYQQQEQDTNFQNIK